MIITMGVTNSAASAYHSGAHPVVSEVHLHVNFECALDIFRLAVIKLSVSYVQ